MVVYILPEMRDKFAKLVARASKHLSVSPKITFSEPMEKIQKTVHVWKDEDGQGCRKYKRSITVIEVEIDDITSGDWVLVADVLFGEGIVTLENSKYFKDIPSYLGLNYFKCDYCGHTNRNRTKSHIVYNTVTREWKQIGTSCGKKMFEAGDICRFTVKLQEIIDISGGCMDFGFGCWSVPDHYWKKAWNIDDVIAKVVMYRKEINPEWEKAQKVNNFETIPGTTDKLLDFRNVEQNEIEDGYIGRVKDFVKELKGGTVVNYWGELENDFNAKIKFAFESGYVLKCDFYTVFFAVKMYEDSLTVGDWESKVSGYKIGEKYSFVGCSLASREEYEDIYGHGDFCKFITPDGITITKTFSNFESFDFQFRNENGTYSFKARVDYINKGKRTVKLGGRVSRI